MPERRHAAPTIPAMPHIDKTLVAARFGARVKSYDSATPIQDRMSHVLLKGVRAHFSAADPGRILELGCGTGRLTRQLADAFPGAAIVAVDISPAMVDATRTACGRVHVVLDDAEKYVRETRERFDLIVSNATVQWFEDTESTLARARRLLDNRGLLAVATFGERTFLELRASFEAAYAVTGHRRANHMVDMYPVGAFRTGFRNAEIAEEFIEQDFADVRSFLRSIQNAGAVNSSGEKHPLPRQVLQEMCRQYSSRFTAADSTRIRATYHVCYLYLRPELQGGAACS
jgi:malonyl-CoA O-methyltransferase